MRIFLLIAAAAWIGCDTLTPSEFESEVVVESYLAVDEPLPEVRLTRTIPLDASYDPDLIAISGAGVRVELLSEGGAVERRYDYRESEVSPGIYRPGGFPTVASVRPLRMYRLVVHAPGERDSITAVTTVPGQMSVVDVNRDSVVFQSDPPLTFELSRPEYPGRQSVFIFSTRAADAVVEQLTPFARGLYEDGDVTLEELSVRMSPVLNAENFEETEDGSLRIQFPWLAIYFYGRNEVTVRALDDNLYDFIRSQSVQQGGSTRPPGEIPNALEHVDGGRGIFGSSASASFGFVVERASE